MSRSAGVFMRGAVPPHQLDCQQIRSRKMPLKHWVELGVLDSGLQSLVFFVLRGQWHKILHITFFSPLPLHQIKLAFILDTFIVIIFSKV